MRKLARARLVLTVAIGMSWSGTLSGQESADSPALRAAQARLRPGDRVFLHVLREPTLTDTVTVNERGQAAFPKLGILAVGDLTIAGLQDTLRTRYSQYLRTPELEVVVLRRVVVNGEVKEPNVYLVEVSATVADAIARAGGFSELANRGKITLVRDGRSERVEGWDKGGARLIELQSGDEIVVGRKHWLVANLLPAVSTATIVASLLITVLR